MTTYPFPGDVADVVTTSRIESTWQKAIRDRMIQVFDTQANRDLALVGGRAPKVGQVSVITTGAMSTATSGGTTTFDRTTGAGLFVYTGPTNGWTPPWDRPWGEVARTLWTAAQSTASATDTVVTAAATQFTARANRIYRAHVSTVERNLAAATAQLNSSFFDGTTLIEVRAWASVPIGLDFQVEWQTDFTLTAGVHTINLRHKSSSASGVSNNQPGTSQWLWIEDMGPAGVPS